MFDGFHSGMSYSAVGHRVNVNEAKMWYIKKREEEIC